MATGDLGRPLLALKPPNWAGHCLAEWR